MPFRLINLNKLLIAVGSSPSQLTTLIRKDIRQDIKKEAEIGRSPSMDFYGPFWADAKKHVAGLRNLRETTAERIARSERSRRDLYNRLQTGFLSWWDERRRLRNEPFTFVNERRRARYEVKDIGIIKIENTLNLKVGDDLDRIIYPYFCSNPSLNPETASIGLWVLEQSFPELGTDSIRLLDVIAGVAYGRHNCPPSGFEQQKLIEKYDQIVSKWHSIRDEDRYQ